MDFLDLICLNSAAAPEPRGGNFYLLDKFKFCKLITNILAYKHSLYNDQSFGKR